MARRRTKPRARILVIDDDKSMLELLKLHLSNAGYDVVTAEDAVVAGRHVFEAAPDLIIADVSMPYMDGYELVRPPRAARAPRVIPVVFLPSRAAVPASPRRS